MSNHPEPEVTQLMRRLRVGDADAKSMIFERMHHELRSLADRLLRGERAEHTLQPTALVHEAFVRLVGSEPGWADRQHLLRLAARAMRHVLVDHARARNAEKRGGGAQRVTLQPDGADERFELSQVIEVHDALDRLARFDSELAQVVEMRFFGGFSEAEIAQALGVSERTIQRSWRTARAWLATSLGDGVEAVGGS